MSRKPDVTRRRGKFRAASVGGYAATALIGATLGIALAGPRIAPSPPIAAQAKADRAAESPAQLQVVVSAPVEPHQPARALPTGLGPAPDQTETAAQPSAPPALPATGIRAANATADAERNSANEAWIVAPPAPPTRMAPPPEASVVAVAPPPRRGSARPPASIPNPAADPAATPPAPPPWLLEAIPERPCDGRCLANQLDDAERTLAASYRDARRAGVPARELRARGEAWLRERSAAASVSAVAMLDAYEMERQELAALAEASRGGRR